MTFKQASSIYTHQKKSGKL